MKKFTGLVIVTATIIVIRMVWAANFSGHQSMNGLNPGSASTTATYLFTAPITGPYFIKAKLSLPMASQGSSVGSGALARVYKNSSVVYTGVTGATGFSMNGLSLDTGDVIRASISSTATIDQGLNVIKGDVFFGNGL